jgi:hypothetical protein
MWWPAPRPETEAHAGGGDDLLGIAEGEPTGHGFVDVPGRDGEAKPSKPTGR